MSTVLNLKNICVKIENRQVIKNLNLSVNPGEIHVIMGPNGCGKSSMAYTLMGHPSYVISNGQIDAFGQNITRLSIDKRAKLGIFLAFQYPHEIPGATVFSVLKESYVAITAKLVSAAKFSEILYEKMDLLQIDREFAFRNLNEGFSGGEKKKFEILQMLVLKPRLVILDEIDSGLDIDSLKIVSQAILHARKDSPQMSFIIITHYLNILRYIQPDFVRIMHSGEIVASGDFSLAKEIEDKGYNRFIDARKNKV